MVGVCCVGLQPMTQTQPPTKDTRGLAGQVIGENTRHDDLVINVIKTKKLSNMRSAGADDKASIAPAIKFSLEEAMEYIGEDEYVEVTPKSIRLRKMLLSEQDRKRNKKSAE